MNVASECQMSALPILGPAHPVAMAWTSGKDSSIGDPIGNRCGGPTAGREVPLSPIIERLIAEEHHKILPERV